MPAFNQSKLYSKIHAYCVKSQGKSDRNSINSAGDQIVDDFSMRDQEKVLSPQNLKEEVLAGVQVEQKAEPV